MGIGERTVNNALFNSISGVIPLVFSFIFWPYIVGQLGDVSYGVYALVGSVIGYFSLLDLGLGDAVVKYVAQYAGTDRRYTEVIVGTALSVFLAAGLIGVVLILSVAGELATDWLKVPVPLRGVAFRAFCIAALGFFMTMQVTLFTSITNGLSRYDISGSVMAVMGVITTLGAALLLRVGLGLIHLVWWNVVVTFSVMLFYVKVSRRLMPDISLRLHTDAAALRKIFRFGKFSMLSRLTGVISRQVNLLVIGAILGVAAVTYYVIPFTILNRLTNLLCRVSMVIFPAISELQGRNQYDTIRALYLTTSRIILSFACAFLIPLLIFGPHFLRLWMDPEFASRGGLVMQILTAGIFFTLCTNVPTFVVNGLGHPKVNGYAAICNALLFLALMIPGAYFWGIAGVAVANLISSGIVSPIFIGYVNYRILALSSRRLLKDSYLRPLLAAVGAGAVQCRVPAENIDNLFLLLGVMGAGAGLYFLLALLCGVYQARERRVLKQYLSNVLRRFRKRRIS